ncbi:glycosyltransferase family protein [Plantactinospora sonchi]|uniref:Glycosyltransferase family 39 protein n=1 Tax=Plantactinospora sonchi TaxID=1544735 RepID=A0ABU7RW73_9ACTN
MASSGVSTEHRAGQRMGRRSAVGTAWARLGVAVRAAWPALALYAGLRAFALLVLWIFATDAGRPLGELLGAYDAIHYGRIVTDGYEHAIVARPDGKLPLTNLAFFPLFPGLIALVDPVLPGGVRTAGILLSWAAGLAAAWGLYAVGSQLRDRRTGIVLAGLWAVIPHALVQSMGYTETLFTALAAWSLVCVLRRQWVTAGVLCLLAGLTRPTGGAVTVAVGLAALFAVIRRRDGWRPWVAGVLAPLGLVGYIAWVGHRMGQVDGYFRVQSEAWGMSYDGGAWTLRELRKVLTEPQGLAMYVTTGVMLLGVALLVLLVAERVPWPLVVYAAVVVALAVGGAGFYYAKARLMVPAFPLLLPVAYALVAARRRVTVLVVFALLTAFSAWYGAYLALDWTRSP